MNEQNSVTAAASQISIGAIIVTLLLFMTLENRTFQLWYPLIWLCYGPLLYGANRLFLRQERSLQALTLLNGCAGVLLFAVFMLADGWHGIWVSAVTAAGCLALSAQAPTLCVEPIKLSSVIQWLDIDLVLLAVFAAYLGELAMPMYWTFPAAIGCGASILGMLTLRAGGRLSSRGWGLLAVLLAVLSGGVWLGVNTVSRGAGKGLLALWNALKAAGLALYNALCQFIKWFAALFPAQEYSELELEQETEMLLTSSLEQMDVSVPWYVYALILLLAATVLVLLLRYLRRFRVQREQPKLQAVHKPRHSRISFWSALKRRLHQITESLRLRLYLYRNRDTVLGAFYGLLRHAYGRSWRHGAVESPREFLTGLARQAEADEALYTALIDLIPAVERALYAPDGKAERYPQASLLRRQRKALFPFSRKNLLRI
ncbi:MAG: hypothetical protein LUH07_14565 [Lachnospiraceae bacterium]|nr:hypothetical protein [Lachnospiraceae bacterium]